MIRFLSLCRAVEAAPARATGALWVLWVGAALLAWPAGGRAAPPGQGWALAWSDEFNGSALDTSKWSVGTGSRRDAVNTASAVSVGDGRLRIKTYTSGGTHYTGWVGTNGKMEECFGYWEARIRFNSSAGMWSAFWLQSAGMGGVGDPAGDGTEIDVAEHRSQDNGGTNLQDKYTINVHWDGYGSDHKSVGSTIGNPGTNPASLQGNFHTYGVLWAGDRYDFYIDGTWVWSTTAAISNVRQWIYLTSEVDSGAWSGSIPSGGYGSASSTSTYFDVDYVRFYQQAERTVNGDFTYRMGPWRQSGQVSWSSSGGIDGTPGVYLNPSTTSGSKAYMTVHGLLPNTPYVVRGLGDVGSRTWPDIRIGAENYGGPPVYGAVWSNGFSMALATFTTGASNTTARVFASVPTQWGTCYADNIYLRRAGRFTNAGFEQGGALAWGLSGDCFVQDWGGSYRRSGSCALRLNASSAARGAEQTIHGLRAGTTYTLSGWVRTAGQPVRFGVKNHGLDETYTAFTGTGNVWQRAEHVFTTGPSSTSATVYLYVPAGSNVAAADVDDFLLGTPLPGEWAATDIGAALAGESCTSDGRLVVRGSGNNLGGTSDSIRWVYQPMVDSGKITAKLNSFEAGSIVAKAGVMIRASTAADAPFAMVHWLTQGQVEFCWRNTAGAAGSYVWAAAATPYPPLLRLTRSGNVVTAHYLSDATTWVEVGAAQALDLPSAALAGLAVTSHDTNNTAEAVFSNVSFTGDRDADGLADDYETNTGIYVSATDTGSDPDNPDTDGDGIPDGNEVLSGTNPLVPNTELIWQPGVSPGGNGTWASADANWALGTTRTVWLPGKTALFGGTAGTVTVGEGADGIAGMIFNTTGYKLEGSGLLSFQPEAFLTLNVAATRIAAPLGGSSSLAVNGGNQLTLAGDNRNFTGSITLAGPATQLRAYDLAAATATGYELGASANTVDVQPGAYIRWFNCGGTPAYPANLRLNGDGTGSGAMVADSASTHPEVTLNGQLSIESDARIYGQNNGRFSVNGTLTGTGTLTWNQDANTSTITGTVALAALTKTGAGTLRLASPTLGIGLLTASAGTVNFNPSGDSTFTGVLAGSGTVTKTGPGTLVLTGPNTFGTAGGTFAFGATNANHGAIRLTHPQALGAHAKVALNGQNNGVSRLELAGGHVFPLDVDSSGKTMDPAYTALRNVSGDNTLQGTVNQSATGGGLAIETLAGSQLAITGNITNSVNAAGPRDIRVSGAGTTIVNGAVRNSTTTTVTLTKLTKEGTGTLVLNGTNTHGDAATSTDVMAGKLVVNGTITVSPVTVAAQAVLGGTGTIPSANVQGTIAIAIGQAPLVVAGPLALAGATLALDGVATAPVHVLVTRASLTGSFASVTGLPVGYRLDTGYNGTAIALVRKPTADYEIWAAAHGLDPAGDGAPGLDHEADGLANGVEFVLGLDPTSGDLTSPNLPAARLSGTDLVVTFTRFKVAATNGFASVVEWSASLAGGTWTAASEAQTRVTDHGDTETVTTTIPLPPGTPRCFARLRVAGP